METVGGEFARSLGYQLYSYSGSGEMARYMKGPLALKVWMSDGQMFAELTATYGLITMTTGRISFPNKHFGIFERQLLGMLNALPPEV